MRIGIICPSEIALRRFMPALQKIDGLEFVGIGVHTAEERFGAEMPEEKIVHDVINQEYDKAKAFIENYGGKIFDGYNSIISSSEVDAIYIPLPPALHFQWAKKALEKGKHVLVEKPSTLFCEDTKYLVELARQKGLALHENYMFCFHNQISEIKEIIESHEIGDVRLYRISFGFPMRAASDFRYNRELGGGALIDAGGYTIKYASMLLGASAKVCYAQMNFIRGLNVDLYGSAALTNDDGLTVQIAFGMDNNYKCDLEVWGSTGCLSTGRVLTAPVGFVPRVIIRKGNKDEYRELSADDTFEKSILHFVKCIGDIETRHRNYSELIRQAELVDEFRKVASGR